MKRYKLYKENILTKTIKNAYGFNLMVLDKLYIKKIIKVAAALDIGGLVIKYTTGNMDSVLLDSIIYTSAGVIMIIFAFTVSDNHKIKNSKKKLDRLESVLKEKGINVKFLFPIVNPNGIVEFPFDLNSSIIYVDDDQIDFYDMKTNRRIDITDEVNECLMSKRQFRKYRKRISKN